MHLPLSSAALQNRLAACLCHCNYTYEGLLLTQVCTDPSPMHCKPGFGNCIPHCPVMLCKIGSQHACDTAITPMNICCSHKCALITTNALQHWFWQMHSHCPVLLCKTGPQHACVTAITPMKVCCSHKCALIRHQCTASLVLANAFTTVQCCSAKQAHSMLVSLQLHL